MKHMGIFLPMEGSPGSSGRPQGAPNEMGRSGVKRGAPGHPFFELDQAPGGCALRDQTEKMQNRRPKGND